VIAAGWLARLDHGDVHPGLEEGLLPLEEAAQPEVRVGEPLGLPDVDDAIAASLLDHGNLLSSGWWEGGEIVSKSRTAGPKAGGVGSFSENPRG